MAKKYCNLCVDTFSGFDKFWITFPPITKICRSFRKLKLSKHASLGFQDELNVDCMTVCSFSDTTDKFT